MLVLCHFTHCLAFPTVNIKMKRMNVLCAPDPPRGLQQGNHRNEDRTESEDEPHEAANCPEVEGSTEH